MSELYKSLETLTEIYWEWVDNKEDKNKIKRLDTIIYKLKALIELLEIKEV